MVVGKGAEKKGGGGRAVIVLSHTEGGGGAKSVQWTILKKGGLKSCTLS